jgi:hypothetical protein
MGFARWGRTDTRVLTGMLGIAFVIEAFWGLVLPMLRVTGTLDVVVAGTSLEEHVPFSVNFSFLPLAVAVLVAAVAEAFRIGVRLREDTEGLV